MKRLFIPLMNHAAGVPISCRVLSCVWSLGEVDSAVKRHIFRCMCQVFPVCRMHIPSMIIGWKQPTNFINNFSINPINLKMPMN